jgi:hypothetical protein
MTEEEVRTVALGEEPRGREGQEEVPVTNTGLQEYT